MNNTTIRIAIPSEAGRLHGHFGGAKEFTLVDADGESQVVTQKQIVVAPPHQPGLFPRWLREQGVHVVLAVGIGRRALELFTRHGITVRAARPGTMVEAATAAYLTGGLTHAPEACEHHEDHEHEPHDHHHDHHHEHHHHPTGQTGT
jgi:predicted Fe-Mo cluster-binding NifX family protein